LPSWGGEYVGFYGLGYLIEFFYPLMEPGNSGSGVSVKINPYPYIIINIAIIIVGVLLLRATKRRSNRYLQKNGQNRIDY